MSVQMTLKLSLLVVILISPILLRWIPFVLRNYITLNFKTLRILKSLRFIFEVVYVLYVIMGVYGLTQLPI